MNKPDMRVSIAGIELKNPVITASGTFGSGLEYSRFADLDRLGAITVKGVSLEPWLGNPAPRLAETYGGMLNSVGLQNPGVKAFIDNDLPFLRKYSAKIIVNICGHTLEEYIGVTEALSDIDGVDFLELNISCPNISDGGASFGTECGMVEKVVSEVKKRSSKPLIVKLSPNVTDISDIAKSAESGGADAISLINTLLGMKIDINRREAVLKRKIGGLSGPAIKPVAVRMVWQTTNAVKLPIIGMGGITSGDDAVEFIMAGAVAVAVGTANFSNPRATIDVLEGLERFAIQNGLSDLSEIRGII